jgi:hypothetical protein
MDNLEWQWADLKPGDIIRVREEYSKITNGKGEQKIVNIEYKREYLNIKTDFNNTYRIKFNGICICGCGKRTFDIIKLKED